MDSENQDESGARLQYAMFATDETPHCLWDFDINERNKEFIKSIDPGYFEHIANIHIQHIEGEDKQYAANALRVTYSQGLESLFALLCAVVQAPDCVVGWLLTYRNNELDSLVNKISKWQVIRTKFSVNPMSWMAVANIIFSGFSTGTGDAEKDKRIIESFGDLWARFASDFLDEKRGNEYNSMKHGIRARMGGFTLAIGLEETPGVAAPPERMMTFARSAFGSSFFVTEKMHDARNFRVKRQSLNWSPENLYYGLRFISMSIANVVTYLKNVYGIEESSRFAYPVDEETFEWPWKEAMGMSMDFNSVIVENFITPRSKEEIFSVYAHAQNSERQNGVDE